MSGVVAIVGAGPRGSSLVERLVANAVGGAVDLTVHLIDPAPPGGGRVWRHDQPPHLLMNTLADDATHFTDETVRCDGPIVEGPTLYGWARAVAAGTIAEDDPFIIEEAGRIEPHGHPSRRLLGAYLRWCHAQDLSRVPDGMRVVHHAARAVAARKQSARWSIALSDGDTVDADALVLANGHVDLDPTIDAPRAAHARRVGGWYGRPGNPLDADLSALGPGEDVIVRGLGMNFFDYVSLLTVGRGGRFEDRDGGLLSYVASGDEPVLHVGSSRGTPYRAKGLFGSMTPVFAPRYLTREVVDRLATRPGVDFRAELWPLIAKDTARVFHMVLARAEPERFATDPQQVLDALDELPWASAELDAALVSATGGLFDLSAWDRPLQGRSFVSADAFRQWWLDDLRDDHDEARRGLDSARKCASVALGQGRGALRRLVAYGGFRGHSYDRDVDRWYRGFAGSLASGPPARRIAELHALTEAGVVEPVGPSLRVTETEDGFAASSPAVASAPRHARALLEAHLPPNRLQQTGDPLLRTLRDAGHLRPYRMPDPIEQTPFVTGAIDVGRSPYRAVSVDGTEDDSLYVFGVPLEHLHYGTQLGPLARSDSAFLRDADAIARAVLNRVAGRGAVHPPRPHLASRPA
ncbi:MULTISPECIES: FAD/NAD(P)-binding protein [unclassified Microbacterium]|uniref:FAD/NAD(P)-binding protein n=1 Tax=unclassified Microbacterium TaxID=2609290 RepID=UPI00300F979F